MDSHSANFAGSYYRDRICRVVRILVPCYTYVDLAWDWALAPYLVNSLNSLEGVTMTEGTIIIERTGDDPDFPFTVFRVDGDGFREFVDGCPDFASAERLACFLDRLWNPGA